MLRDFCSVPSKNEDSTFVGMRFENGRPHVYFPRGFALQESDASIRRDILRLLEVIRKFGDYREGTDGRSVLGDTVNTFPLLAYQTIIYDFIANGYYHETETVYVNRPQGKINWKRTIQQINPHIDNGNIVYLNYIVRTNRVNTDNLLSQIYKYCVHESFSKLGWLYTSSTYVPPAPDISFNKNLFLSVLMDEVRGTFNDSKRMLLNAMMKIVSSSSDNEELNINDGFGVEKFDKIWERLIDYIFGEENREIYFPHGHWFVVQNNQDRYESSELIPDTIIKYQDKIYILDAKNYRFGITGISNHLPATDSIQKQITYGEYVEAKKFADRNKIFNAFILPFCRENNDEPPFKFAAVGVADWKEYSPQTPNYTYILGILMDTRYTIMTYSRYNMSDIERMTALIEDSVQSFRKSHETILFD